MCACVRMNGNMGFGVDVRGLMGLRGGSVRV